MKHATHEKDETHAKAHHKDDDGLSSGKQRRETLGHTQPYDATKGFDECKYDMSKGEIANPAVPEPHAPAVAPLPGHQSTGLCVECGKPTAPGQTYVCRDHTRFE
jgi:hypothetical protein